MPLTKSHVFHGYTLKSSLVLKETHKPITPQTVGDRHNNLTVTHASSDA